MTNLFNNIIFATRSNDGVVMEHPSLNDALEAFMADDGYRLDFLFPEGKVLFIHRAEYNEDIPEEKINHPAYKNYYQANAKVMLYDPHKTSDLNTNTNVIPLFS
jgi:hypothetical protein